MKRGPEGQNSRCQMDCDGSDSQPAINAVRDSLAPDLQDVFNNGRDTQRSSDRAACQRYDLIGQADECVKFDPSDAGTKHLAQ